jgi:hypothetical protein
MVLWSTATHQETPPNYKDVLFSRCFKMTCKMFYSQKDVLSFENILNMFKKFLRCFEFSKYLLDVSRHLSEI